ncbi:MAG: helix-turn-helix domain-containing protein [Clostridia bacterium]|nr:helix-turn-helix domain-containing protein [Clostridia bacterium]
MELKDFGINLAKLRIKANLSGYELSLMIGKNTTYIHKVENGKINVSLKVILQICEVLNIEPVELFKPVNDKSE